MSDEPVACDAKGRANIVRQAYLGRTTVWKDDGSKRTFGKNTTQSLLMTPQSHNARWLQSLSDVELRGLVHEIGQQLLESSHLYRFHESQLECIGIRDGRDYFGLTETSTLKDMENAYRKMAKRMHPDKNGGTEHAKRQFQQLNERHTALKKRWGTGEVEPRRHDDCADEGGSILYDPTNRKSMSDAALEILRKMGTIQKSTSAMQPPPAASNVRVTSTARNSK
jgi:hypothetical protein